MLIDKNEYFEFTCTNTKGLIDENYFDRTTIDFKKVRSSFRDSKVSFKRGKLVRVSDKSQTIDIEVPNENATTNVST